MKKNLFKTFSVFLALLLLNMQTFAFTVKANAPITQSDILSVTDFNESEIYDAFADVSDLDQYLALNDNKTFTDISQKNGTLLNGIASSTTLPLTASSDELVLGIPSFLWGCVFNVAGMVVVYLVLENKEETKKALYGCIASTVVWVALNFLVFAVATTAATTTYSY